MSEQEDSGGFAAFDDVENLAAAAEPPPPEAGGWGGDQVAAAPGSGVGGPAAALLAEQAAANELTRQGSKDKMGAEAASAALEQAAASISFPPPAPEVAAAALPGEGSDAGDGFGDFSASDTALPAGPDVAVAVEPTAVAEKDDAGEAAGAAEGDFGDFEEFSSPQPEEAPEEAAAAGAEPPAAEAFAAAAEPVETAPNSSEGDAFTAFGAAGEEAAGDKSKLAAALSIGSNADAERLGDSPRQQFPAAEEEVQGPGSPTGDADASDDLAAFSAAPGGASAAEGSGNVPRASPAAEDGSCEVLSPEAEAAEILPASGVGAGSSEDGDGFGDFSGSQEAPEVAAAAAAAEADSSAASATSAAGAGNSDDGDGFGDISASQEAPVVPEAAAAAADSSAVSATSAAGAGSAADEEEDEFGAFDDAPQPPAQPAAAAPAPPSGSDLLALPPPAFLAAAASLLSSLLPAAAQQGRGSSQGASSQPSSTARSLPTFDSLTTRYPKLCAWVAAAAPGRDGVVSSSAGQVHHGAGAVLEASSSQSAARLLQRMGVARASSPANRVMEVPAAHQVWQPAVAAPAPRASSDDPFAQMARSEGSGSTPTAAIPEEAPLGSSSPGAQPAAQPVATEPAAGPALAQQQQSHPVPAEVPAAASDLALQPLSIGAFPNAAAAAAAADEDEGGSWGAWDDGQPVGTAAVSAVPHSLQSASARLDPPPQPLQRQLPAAAGQAAWDAGFPAAAPSTAELRQVSLPAIKPAAASAPEAMPATAEWDDGGFAAFSAAPPVLPPSTTAADPFASSLGVMDPFASSAAAADPFDHSLADWPAPAAPRSAAVEAAAAAAAGTGCEESIGLQPAEPAEQGDAWSDDDFSEFAEAGPVTPGMIAAEVTLPACASADPAQNGLAHGSAAAAPQPNGGPVPPAPSAAEVLSAKLADLSFITSTSIQPPNFS